MLNAFRYSFWLPALHTLLPVSGDTQDISIVLDSGEKIRCSFTRGTVICRGILDRSGVLQQLFSLTALPD